MSLERGVILDHGFIDMEIFFVDDWIFFFPQQTSRVLCSCGWACQPPIHVTKPASKLTNDCSVFFSVLMQCVCVSGVCVWCPVRCQGAVVSIAYHSGCSCQVCQSRIVDSKSRGVSFLKICGFLWCSNADCSETTLILHSNRFFF